MRLRVILRTCALLTVLAASACVPAIDRGPAAVQLDALPVQLISLNDGAAAGEGAEGEDGELVHIAVRTTMGSASAAPGQEGLPALALHARVMGYRPAFDRLGAVLTTRMERDWSQVGVTCEARWAHACLEAVVRLLTSAATGRDAEGAWEAARGEVVAALEEQAHDPGAQVGLALHGLVFEAHPYASAAGGRLGALDGLTERDAEAFLSLHLVRRGMVVGVGGARGPELIEAARLALQEVPIGAVPEPNRFSPPRAQGRALVIVPSEEGHVAGGTWVGIGHAVSLEPHLISPLAVGLEVLRERLGAEHPEVPAENWHASVPPRRHHAVLLGAGPLGAGEAAMVVTSWLEALGEPGELGATDVTAAWHRLLEAGNPADRALHTALFLSDPLQMPTVEAVQAALATHLRPADARIVIAGEELGGPTAEEFGITERWVVSPEQLVR